MYVYTHTNLPGSGEQSGSMGWLRLVGSIKLQVSFPEYSLFYRALLQKRPIIQSILLTVATPLHIWRQQQQGPTQALHIYVYTCLCI